VFNFYSEKCKKLKKEKEKKQPKIVENIESVPVGKDAHFGVENNQAELKFQAFSKKMELKKKVLKIAGISFLLLMMIAASAAVYFRNKNAQQSSAVKQQVQMEIPKNEDHIFVNESGNVSKEQNAVVVAGDDLKGIAGKSENYKIKDIAIGGANIVLAAETEALPLKAMDVRSEMLMTKDGKKMQVLISWKTNKLAKSEVKYAKDGKGAEKNIKEYGYGFSHALVLNNLEQATRYVFTVSVTDRSGNVSVSDAIAVYTGSKPVSVIELISSEMESIFGWALKK